MRYCIIGNGVAGHTAALAIRELDRQGELTILSEEPYPFYSRIRLIDLLAGRVEPEGIVLARTGRYASLGIDLRTSCPVTAIDPAARTVETAGGTRLGYDRLLVATGARVLVPPLPGAQLPGVMTLRSLDDAVAVRAAAQTAASVVVIGGGVLGLEVANSLLAPGRSMTVIEIFDRLLPRQLDQAASRLLQAQLAARGLAVVLAGPVQALCGRERVTGVQLCDGRLLPADLVLLSTGICAEQSLLRPLGLAGERGVAVDDRLATARPEIFAAGDLVCHRQRMYGIWPAAEAQGRVAGTVMAGGRALYTGTTTAHTLKVAGIDLLAVGDIDAEGRLPSLVHQDEAAFVYRKLVVDGDRLAGAILYGDLRHRQRVLRAVTQGLDIRPYAEALAAGDLGALP
ncbi:MAG: FAD-dependent oxidoreductase [Thermodesulfobacteriota bacterium]